MRFTVAVGHLLVVAVVRGSCAIDLIGPVIEIRAASHLHVYRDLVAGQAESPLRTRDIVDVRNYAEAVFHVGYFTEWKIPVMVSAETRAGRARAVMKVWP